VAWQGWRRVPFGLCGVCIGLVLLGCGGARPLLRPASDAVSTVDIGAGVRISIGPVTDAAEWQPDDIALMSRFFSALWVQIHNESASALTIDPSDALIFDQSGTPWLALDGAQRTQAIRWHPWSWHAWLARWWWADRLDQLLKKMNRLELQQGTVAAGGERSGLLVFKMIPMPMCRQAEFDWTPVPIGNGSADASGLPRTRPSVRMRVEC
jgi:hypothetical protein